MSKAKNIRNAQGFSHAVSLLVLVVLAVIGGLGFYLYRLSHESQSPASLQSPDPTSRSTVPAPEFDIESFYTSIQNGMSPDEVIKLAGKQPDDCGSTDAIPPSVTCFWNSGDKSVTVSYGNKDAVQAKNKTGF